MDKSITYPLTQYIAATESKLRYVEALSPPAERE
jgi:hypothetical protein